MIRTIDNFLPEDMYDKLAKRFEQPMMYYGWKAHNQNDPHGHWNHQIGISTHQLNLADISSKLDDQIKEIWDYVSNKYKELKDNKIIRCYVNGHTYGVDGYFHKDSSRKDEITIVVYLTEEWKLDWAGETVFAKDGDLIHSSLPKKNRAAMFDASILHAARGVSRQCYQLRKTFMIKTRKARTDNFEKISSFAFKNGATDHKHQKGTLHDHLVRVYQLLEDKGLDKSICFAGGLHSVFGTNAFTNNILTLNDEDKVVAEFGQRAYDLAALCSIIDRPKTLISPNSIEGDNVYLQMRDGRTVVVDKETFDALRYIECANLLDQNSLKDEGLIAFWNQNDENNK